MSYSVNYMGILEYNKYYDIDETINAMLSYAQKKGLETKVSFKEGFQGILVTVDAHYEKLDLTLEKTKKGPLVVSGGINTFPETAEKNLLEILKGFNETFFDGKMIIKTSEFSINRE